MYFLLDDYVCMYMVELHEAEKPIFAIIDTHYVSQCPVGTLD